MRDAVRVAHHRITKRAPLHVANVTPVRRALAAFTAQDGVMTRGCGVVVARELL
jgi:hypothetical protein